MKSAYFIAPSAALRVSIDSAEERAADLAHRLFEKWIEAK